MKADPNKYDHTQHISLRAEAFCAALLDNGIYFDDLSIDFAGSFRRAYRNDIDSVTTEDDKITLILNRDGFYDKLPEGLFHQSLGSSRTAVLRDMVGEHRRYKEEERAARKFFQPLQQEIFHFAVAAEKEERDILFSTLNGQVSEAFFRFWDIDPELPRKPAETLIKLMPLQNRIKTDKELIAKSLQLCLDKPITVTEVMVERQSSKGSHFTTGGESMLGLDTVSGGFFSESSVRWTFIINDIAPSETSRYREGEPFGKFLARFTEIFLPIEIDVAFAFRQKEVTGDSEQEYIVGYGFYL